MPAPGSWATLSSTVDESKRPTQWPFVITIAGESGAAVSTRKPVQLLPRPSTDAMPVYAVPCAVSTGSPGTVAGSTGGVGGSVTGGSVDGGSVAGTSMVAGASVVAGVSGVADSFEHAARASVHTAASARRRTVTRPGEV